MPDRTNDQWLSDLRAPGPQQEAALGDLRASILKALPYALSVWLSPSDPQFQSLSEEVAQETLLRVLEKADTFEGRSKFTTWVHKIAVRIALSELRRRRWKDVSLDAIVDEAESSAGLGLMADTAASPDLAAEQADMLANVARVIQEELTEKQRTVLIASRIRGMPATEIARRMGMKRNALYKLMHDARLKLKKRLADEGLRPEDVLAAFEGE
ncbi:MAG: sigma-70 family RNA polymerase sigma factor [Anaerolineales bacterium]|jgi:RNA polymerase sigma-70 factor (ECF subfamily)